MRLATNPLFLALSIGLAVNAPGWAQSSATAPAALTPQQSVLLARGLATLGAGAQAGYEAQGTATITEADGRTESGPVTVRAWGFDHCRISIDLSTPGRSRRYEAVSNGAQAHVRAPARLALAAADPLGPALGCALLAQALPWSQAATAPGGGSDAVQLGPRLAATIAPGTGLPLSTAWTDRGRPVVLTYSGYQSTSGVTFAGAVVESVAGVARVTIQFSSIQARNGLSDADFAVPAPPNPPALKRPGGGQ